METIPIIINNINPNLPSQQINQKNNFNLLKFSIKFITVALAIIFVLLLELANAYLLGLSLFSFNNDGNYPQTSGYVSIIFLYFVSLFLLIFSNLLNLTSDNNKSIIKSWYQLKSILLNLITFLLLPYVIVFLILLGSSVIPGLFILMFPLFFIFLGWPIFIATKFYKITSNLNNSNITGNKKDKLDNKESIIALSTIITLFIFILIVFPIYITNLSNNENGVKIDNTRIDDLKSINKHIKEFYIRNKVLPINLLDLTDKTKPFTPYHYDNGFVDFLEIYDPLSKKLYDYKKLSNSKYQLCANYSADSSDQQISSGKEPLFLEKISYLHKKGYYCINVNLSDLLYELPIYRLNK